jgi:hypothetical protein
MNTTGRLGTEERPVCVQNGGQPQEDNVRVRPIFDSLVVGFDVSHLLTMRDPLDWQKL